MVDNLFSSNWPLQNNKSYSFHCAIWYGEQKGIFIVPEKGLRFKDFFLNVSGITDALTEDHATLARRVN